jgi:hypothetical protein
MKQAHPLDARSHALTCYPARTDPMGHSNEMPFGRSAAPVPRDNRLPPSRPSPDGRTALCHEYQAEPPKSTEIRWRNHKQRSAEFCRPLLVLAWLVVRSTDIQNIYRPGAPLRNRTVDLLLTIESRTVPHGAAQPFEQPKRWRPGAEFSPEQPPRAASCPPICPPNQQTKRPSGSASDRSIAAIKVTSCSH